MTQRPGDRASRTTHTLFHGIVFFIVGIVVVVLVIFLGKILLEQLRRFPESKIVFESGAQSRAVDIEGTTPKILSLAKVSSADHLRGRRDAEVSIIEFGDTECPYCKLYHPILKQILEKYEGRVNWVYRHYPITTLHKKAVYEAQATECAADLGGNEVFWKYLDRIYEVTPSNDELDPTVLFDIATNLGLDEELFSRCLSIGAYSAKISNHMMQAELAGAFGTPHTVLVSKTRQVPLYGIRTFEELSEEIDALLTE